MSNVEVQSSNPNLKYKKILILPACRRQGI